jgi:hypothetical protein
MPTYLTDRLLLSTTLLGLSVFFILEATATDIPKMVTTDVTAGMNQVSILLIVINVHLNAIESSKLYRLICVSMVPSPVATLRATHWT